MLSHSKNSSLNIDDECIKRKKITNYCLKSLNLEGIDADKECLSQLELLDSGKISMEEFIANMLKKAGVKNNPLK